MGDRLFATLQYLLPKHWLSSLAYRVTRSRNVGFKNFLIRNFLRGYNINMAEAAQSDPFAYASFNDFFTRALKPEARSIASDADAVVSPVDGTVSQVGNIDGDLLIQAKGHTYSLTALVGGDPQLAAKFTGGSFACIYLAPYNYHRIHFATDAQIEQTLYVPGEVFSVNAATARTINSVFARNERAVCLQQTPAGSAILVLVGALFVSGIETVWSGELNPPRRRHTTQNVTAGIGRKFSRGDELGRFNMGSTVILLFEPGRIRWEAALAPGATVKLGQKIATVARASA